MLDIVSINSIILSKSRSEKRRVKSNVWILCSDHKKIGTLYITGFSLFSGKDGLTPDKAPRYAWESGSSSSDGDDIEGLL